MPEDFAQRRQAALMRVGVSRMNALDSAAKANTEAHALAPVVASRLATLKTVAAVCGGVLLTATVARTVFKGSRKAAAAGAARSMNPWGALALQLATVVAIPALRRYLAADHELPPAGIARAPHPLGAIGTMFNLPRIDLNPTRAFYRWLGLEK